MVKIFDFSSPENFIEALKRDGVMVYTSGGKFKSSPSVTSDESVFMYVADNNDELVSIILSSASKVRGATKIVKGE